MKYLTNYSPWLLTLIAFLTSSSTSALLRLSLAGTSPTLYVRLRSWERGHTEAAKHDYFIWTPLDKDGLVEPSMSMYGCRTKYICGFYVNNAIIFHYSTMHFLVALSQIPQNNLRLEIQIIIHLPIQGFNISKYLHNCYTGLQM